MTKMRKNKICFAKVKPSAIIPTKDKGNAGYDIYANFEEDYKIIPPHQTTMIPTGIASAMCNNYYLQVEERGSTGSKGIKKSSGVIDPSYRGEIFIAISNVNDSPIIISKLSEDILRDKYEVIDSNGFFYIPYTYNSNSDEEDLRNVYFENDTICYNPIVYPYKKAIAQLIVHEVPKMQVKEISYDELKSLPSDRGCGLLGSSGK